MSYGSTSTHRETAQRFVRHCPLLSQIALCKRTYLRFSAVFINNVCNECRVVGIKFILKIVACNLFCFPHKFKSIVAQHPFFYYWHGMSLNNNHNTHRMHCCVSTAKKMVTPTCRNVTLYVRYLSCFVNM